MGCKNSKPLASAGSNAGVAKAQRPMTKRRGEEFAPAPTTPTKVSFTSAACLPENADTNALSDVSIQDEIPMMAHPGETAKRVDEDEAGPNQHRLQEAAIAMSSPSEPDEETEQDLNEAADAGVEAFRPYSPDEHLQQREAMAKLAPMRQQREVEFETPPAKVSPASAPFCLPENTDTNASFEIYAQGEKSVARLGDTAKRELGGDDKDSKEETAITESLPDNPDENIQQDLSDVDPGDKVLNLDPCSLDEHQLQKEATAKSTPHIIIHDDDSAALRLTETEKDYDFVVGIAAEPTVEMPATVITPPGSPASSEEAETPSSVNSFSTDRQRPIRLYAELTASPTSPARPASSGSNSIGNDDGKEPLLPSPVMPSPRRDSQTHASFHPFANSPAALSEPVPSFAEHSGSDLGSSNHMGDTKAEDDTVSNMPQPQTPAIEQKDFLTTAALKKLSPFTGSLSKITQSAANSFNALKQLRPFEVQGSRFRMKATNFFDSLKPLCPFDCQGSFSTVTTSVACSFDALKQVGCAAISFAVANCLGPLKQRISFNRRGFLPTRNKFNFVPLVCALVTLMLHVATIFSGEFVWDDRAAVLSNADVLGQGSLLDLLRNDFWGQDLTLETSHKSWRPAAVLSLRWSYNLHGSDARGFHFHNVLLHALVTYFYSAFCFQLITSYLGKQDEIARTAANLASAIFAVHPIHTEPVASIVGRSDLLCGLFFIAAMTIYRVGQRESGPRRLALAHAAGALSTLSKEVGVAAFGVLAASEGIFHRAALPRSTSSRSFVRNAVVSIMCAVLVTALHLSLHGDVKIYNWTILENSISLMESRHSRMLSYCHVAALYLWKMVFPFSLSYDWGWPCIGHVESIFDLRNAGTLVAFLSTLSIALWSFGARDAIAMWAVALMIIPFVPASNLFFPVGTILAERLLYLPSMGFSLGAGYSMAHLLSKTPSSTSAKSSQLVKLLIGTYIASMGLKTLHRCTEWSTEARLFESALRVCPSSLKVLNNYARLHLETDPRRAVQYLEEATRLHEDYATAHFNKGLALSNLGDTLESIKSFAKSLALEPTDGRVRPLLAGAMLSHAKSLSNASEAKQHMADALSLVDESIKHFDSENSRARALYLRCELGHALGFDAKANLRYCEAALDANRETTDRIDEDVTLNMAGIISKEMGEYEAAVEYFGEGLKRNAESYDILVNLASLHGDMNNYELATVYFERAEGLDVRDPLLRAYLLANKGWLKERQGLRLAAREHYSEAVGLTQPNPHPQIVANLDNIDAYCSSNKCE